jgi:hypothetical protein
VQANATAAQGEAFEFLAKQEDEVAQTAKTKKGFYLAATGLFAAGAIAAAYEQYQLGQAKKDIITGQGLQKVPQTAAQGTTLINNARLTINKVTCSSQTDTDAVKGENAAAKEQSDYDAAKARQEANKTPEQLATDKNAQNIKDQKIIEDYDNKHKAPVNQNGDGSNKNIREQYKIECEDTGLCVIPKLKKGEKEKLNSVALYNLSQAKDAEQMLQLMKEHQAIEFENYSKVTYIDDTQKDLKDISLPKEVSQMIAASLMPEAHAEEGGGGGGKLLGIAATALPMILGLKSVIGGLKFQGGQPIDGKALEGIKGSAKSSINKAIGKPVTRIVINGVLGGWMGIMSSHMSKQQKISQERAAKLRAIKSDFASVNGILNCTDDDRNDASKPKCYCFTSDRKFNTSRSNNEVCNQAFKGLVSELKLLPIAKVCVNAAMAMDANCKCRATNTCLKTTRSFSMKGFNPSAFKMISTGAGPADGLFSGVTSAGDITDSATINAARIQKAASDMVAKLDPKGGKARDSFASGLEKSLLATGAGLSMGGQGSRSSGVPSSPSAAAAELEKELKANKDEIDITKATTDDAGGGGFDAAEEPVPEFGATDANSQEIEIAEVMSQEVDFGSNDIKGSDSNIFEVLSNRYQRSGMRRLFEDQVKSDADKPADTDIAE